MSWRWCAETGAFVRGPSMHERVADLVNLSEATGERTTEYATSVREFDALLAALRLEPDFIEELECSGEGFSGPEAAGSVTAVGEHWSVCVVRPE